VIGEAFSEELLDDRAELGTMLLVSFGEYPARGFQTASERASVDALGKRELVVCGGFRPDLGQVCSLFDAVCVNLRIGPDDGAVSVEV
jgi:hypothetical protein